MRIVNYRRQDDNLLLEFSSPIQRLCARPRGDGKQIDLPFTVSGDQVEIALSGLQAILPDEVRRYDLVAFHAGQDHGSVVTARPDTRPRWMDYFRPHSWTTPLVPHLYVEPEGSLAIIVRNPSYVDFGERQFSYAHELTSLRLRRGTIHCSFRLDIAEEGDFEIERCYLKLFSNDHLTEIDAAEFRQRPVDASICGDMTIDIPAGGELPPLRYALYIRLHERRTGHRIDLRTNHLSRQLYDEIRSWSLPPKIRLDGDRVLVVGSSPTTSLVSFIVRPSTRYDTTPLRQLAFATAARIESRLRRALRRSLKPTMMLFEKEASTAQDNGFALFQYLLENPENREFDYYYIMDQNSEQWNRVRHLDRVVRKFSLRYWRLLVSPSSFLVSSDVRFHISCVYAQPGLADKYAFLRKNYFLQHGVIGLKRVTLFTPRSAAFPEVTVTSADWEKDLLVASGVPEASVVVTGLARWDLLPTGLHETARASSRQVLYMPTWRDWLAGQNSQELQGSEYATTIRAFLSSPELHRLLRTHDAELLFLPHPKFKDFSSIFDDLSERVITLSQNDVSFTDLVSQSEAVISDYSSIIWDFVQSRKPAILYQFDLERYRNLTGMYNSKEFGAIIENFPVAFTQEKLMEHLTHLLESNSQSRKNEAEAVAQAAFPFQDRNNRHRILESIDARIPYLVNPRAMSNYDQADAWYRQHLTRQPRAPIARH